MNTAGMWDCCPVCTDCTPGMMQDYRMTFCKQNKLWLIDTTCKYDAEVWHSPAQAAMLSKHTPLNAHALFIYIAESSPYKPISSKHTADTGQLYSLAQASPCSHANIRAHTHPTQLRCTILHACTCTHTTQLCCNIHTATLYDPPCMYVHMCTPHSCAVPSTQLRCAILNTCTCTCAHHTAALHNLTQKGPPTLQLDEIVQNCMKGSNWSMRLRTWE